MGNIYLKSILDIISKYLLSIKTEVEIIVIDDASTDESVEYLQQNYGDTITLLKKETNSGFSETCNLGIKQANNDLIFLA